MVRVVVDRSACVGAGLCVLSAGSVFDQSDEDGLVVLLQDRPGAQDLAGVEQAVHRCPSRALRLEPLGPHAVPV